jgi:hypothetical protein
MITKIVENISKSNHGTIDSADIFIADLKSINGGDISVHSAIDNTINCFLHIENSDRVNVDYVTFHENALKDNSPSGQVKQCECVLFPNSQNPEDWVLFVEIKNSSTIESAFNKGYNYPNNSIEQIISTVSFFRDKNILPKDKLVHAIVAFPLLLQSFSEAFMALSNYTYTDLHLNYKIRLSPTNTAKIISSKRIKT